MAEYIEREAVLNKQIGVVVYDEGGWDANVRAVPVEEIEAIPAADVAPVVRCKECKHGNMFSEEKHLIDCPYYDDQVVDFEHFCAYGERRADNG